MKILNRDFIGPLELEYHNLPKEHGVYVLAYIEKDKIKPIYIGFTRDLKHRINSLLIQSPIPKEILKDSEVKLFYSLFDQENYLQGQAFEIELIKKFDPTYNTNKYKYIEQGQSTDNKIERTRKFSSIVAAFTSLTALSTAVYFSTGLLFDKNSDNTNLILVDNSKIAQEYRSALKSIEASKKDIEAVKSEVKSLSSKPSNASWALESSKLSQRISSLESRLTALEAALTVDPAKSLAIPLLRKDLDNTQNAFKIELAQSKSEVDRVYDQNKWFIGMMVTVAVAVLGMAINNFFSKKS